MFKSLKISLLVVLAVGFLASCQNSKEAASARENTTENQVQPSATDLANNTAANVTPQPAAPAGPTTTMTFEETEFDFGIVNDGDKVSHVYKFKNTGSEPLIISDAKGSCGCTVPKWPREPIAPGAESEILVEFNSKNKKGKRNNKVTITANTNPPQSFLVLKGEVQGGETTAAPNISVNK